MTSEEVFNAAVGWANGMGTIFRELIAEVGLTQTLVVAEKHGEDMGAGFVNELEKLGGFTPEAMSKLKEHTYLPMGLINIEIKATPTSLDRSPSAYGRLDNPVQVLHDPPTTHL